MLPSPIQSSIDFSAQGCHHGYLKVPHSTDNSAWGHVMIPITVIRNGEGPTALLVSGSHGDEYEGPVALIKLAGVLSTKDVSGCVVIVPFLNYPAFRAASRTSPIDQGNLNRAFPGDPKGTVTQKIADYVTQHLLPMASYVLDIHSGGKTLDFLPFAAAHILEDKVQQARCEAAMRAFGAPYSMTMLELDSVGMFDTVAEAAGTVFVTTELGGGGSARASTIGIADHGVRMFLAHAGICQGPAVHRPSVHLEMPSDDCFIISEHAGLLELCIDLGDVIRTGDMVARIHDMTRTGVQAVTYRAKRGGILAGRHFPGLIASGDTLAVVATMR